MPKIDHSLELLYWACYDNTVKSPNYNMRQPKDNSHHHRASVIVLDKKQRRFLMMYRREQGKEKFVTLGGGSESDETPEQTAIREIKEEAGLDVTLDKKLATIEYKNCTDHVFLATEFSGTPKLSGEEKERHSEDNFYEPRWIEIDKLQDLKIPIYPDKIVPLIVRGSNPL